MLRSPHMLCNNLKIIVAFIEFLKNPIHCISNNLLQSKCNRKTIYLWFYKTSDNSILSEKTDKKKSILFIK